LNRKVRQRTASLVAIILVLLGTLLFLTDRYVFTPRSMQRSLFGQPLTALGDVPTFDHDRGFGPWDKMYNSFADIRYRRTVGRSRQGMRSDRKGGGGADPAAGGGG